MSWGNRLKLQAGGGQEGNGESLIVLCIDWRFCVLTHPRDRWEIKRRRKERMNSRFWTGRWSYCTFLWRGKCNRRHLFKLENRWKTWELLHRCSGSDTEKSFTMMQNCMILQSYNKFWKSRESFSCVPDPKGRKRGRCERKKSSKSVGLRVCWSLSLGSAAVWWRRGGWEWKGWWEGFLKTQTVAGGSQGEETRLCSACCLVESVKKNINPHFNVFWEK